MVCPHPNLIAFLTHGGINSITEALNIGKPVIIVPVFGDQMRNGILAERAGFGKMLTIPDITSEGKLRKAFAEMLNNNSYMLKAKQLARMIARRPNPSREQLIRHVEFAAEFGRIPNFDPYGRKMSFVSYFMLDIIVPFLLLVAMIVLGVLYLLYRASRKYIFRMERKKTEKKEQ
ncbi:unnamed protein product [Gongylonema pulchrum]|uniref:glucuronosyltransferase n=1 Tax=Gongylonema pulchrum TaxID=637853 RepID=A0A183D758_9BILA|nr:unnamed protein product [Gongylonema pulchrum]